MNKDLNAEIEQMANKLEKASETPSDKLFSVIKSLGSEGIKEKMATLSDDEKVVLKAALEEMTLKKAVSFDKEIQSAKVIQGNIMDTIIQEEIGSDDADEKLMKPEAAHQNHQGNPTDGWSGQVIKSEEEKAEDKKKEDKKKEKKMEKSELIETINKSDELIETVVSTLLTKGMKHEEVAEKCAEKGMDKKKVQGALDKFKGKGKEKGDNDAKGEFGNGEFGKAEKEEDKEKASKKLMQMEEKEHGTKDPKKLIEAEKKEHMKKADPQGNPEQDQSGDTKQMTEESKDLGDETQSAAKANKKTQEQVNNTKVDMKKACNWEGEDRLLKANTQGRNFNFNLEAFADEIAKSTSTSDDIKKSSGKEDDLNDLIAKSEDKSWDQVKEKRQKEENEKKKNGKVVKSFDEVTDLAAVMGITEAAARKILES
jgi:hypothetical protein